jgi:hypothetical protein
VPPPADSSWRPERIARLVAEKQERAEESVVRPSQTWHTPASPLSIRDTRAGTPFRFIAAPPCPLYDRRLDGPDSFVQFYQLDTPPSVIAHGPRSMDLRQRRC